MKRATKIVWENHRHPTKFEESMKDVASFKKKIGKFRKSQLITGG